MAQFGAYQINRACRHSFGALEMNLEVGRYEPQSAEELEAMAHLASVPPPAVDDSQVPGVPFAVKIEDPDGAAVGETGMVRPTSLAEESPLPEPPVEVPAPPVVSPPAAASPTSSTADDTKTEE